MGRREYIFQQTIVSADFSTTKQYRSKDLGKMTAREMFSVWLYLKDNMNCGSKVSDVIRRGERPMSSRSFTLNDDIRDELSADPIDSEMREVIFGQNCTRNWFTVLEIGDPSRNIIEMIFKAASTQPSRNSRKIKEVLRVHNSIETLEKFEKYRETVKNKSTEQYKKHPRSMVDGNEQLLFYSTTMSCCTVQTFGVTKLCRDSTCRVCRILQSSFSTANNGKNGILLSTHSEEITEAPNAVTKGKNVNSVVIICRVIAGRVVNMVERESEYDCDLVANGKLNYLLVKHPSAVLPCFVIVLK